MPDPDLILTTKLAETYRRLGETYGLPVWQSHGDPTGQLVATILSQNTSDVNTARSFQALIDAYPDWQAVVDAPEQELIEVIRSGGLANQKAPRIQGALRRIYEERGDFDLHWLADLPVAEARAWLTQMPGVGNKTASIVLLFALGRPAFPVDTHVGRVSRRLGLAPANASADKVMVIIEAFAPTAWFYPLHINFIRHGRSICKARKPRCPDCVLQDICDWYRENRDAESQKNSSNVMRKTRICRRTPFSLCHPERVKHPILASTKRQRRVSRYIDAEIPSVSLRTSLR